jgi:hypothetical protein
VRGHKKLPLPLTRNIVPFSTLQIRVALAFPVHRLWGEFFDMSDADESIESIFIYPYIYP